MWPDTFTNYFEPEIAIAAVEVLEAAGYRGTHPAHRTVLRSARCSTTACCRTAKRWLRHVVHELRGPVSAGLSIVGLEPSCTAVFRDELPNLFPNDADAHRLSQASVTLAEFLAKSDYQPPRLHREVLVQRHCHDSAVLDPAATDTVLRDLGVDVDLPDSGCCGMAGSFGYERGDKYRVSVAAGERVILPAVRNAAPDTLIMADGFSCRQQILQLTGRTSLHLAQLLRLAQEQLAQQQ